MVGEHQMWNTLSGVIVIIVIICSLQPVLLAPMENQFPKSPVFRGCYNEHYGSFTAS